MVIHRSVLVASNGHRRNIWRSLKKEQTKLLAFTLRGGFAVAWLFTFCENTPKRTSTPFWLAWGYEKDVFCHEWPYLGVLTLRNAARAKRIVTILAMYGWKPPGDMFERVLWHVCDMCLNRRRFTNHNYKPKRSCHVDCEAWMGTLVNLYSGVPYEWNCQKSEKVERGGSLFIHRWNLLTRKIYIYIYCVYNLTILQYTIFKFPL